MARASVRLIQALRRTALRLEDEQVTYRWSHFAHCNCGHLVQTLTDLSPREIQEKAMRHEGDWGEQARQKQTRARDFHPDYGDRPALDEGAWEPENVGACAATGTPLDAIFDQLEELGLSADDIQNLERLSDSDVRRRLGKNTVDYPHFLRENVVAYLRAWADLLEDRLSKSVCDKCERDLPQAAE